MNAGVDRQMGKVWLLFWEGVGLSHRAARAAVTDLPAVESDRCPHILVDGVFSSDAEALRG